MPLISCSSFWVGEVTPPFFGDVKGLFIEGRDVPLDAGLLFFTVTAEGMALAGALVLLLALVLMPVFAAVFILVMVRS